MKKQLLQNISSLRLILLALLMATPGADSMAGCTTPTYCTPTGNTNIYGNGYITEFKITDPSNNVLIDKTASAQSGCCAYINNMAAGTPDLTQGVTYTISGSRKDIDFLNAWNYGMNIWIDY